VRRITIHLICVAITFFAGLGANSGIDSLGKFAIDEFWQEGNGFDGDQATFLEPNTNFGDHHRCGVLLVTVTANGDLYLNSEQAGTISDKGVLAEKLRQVFELRHEHQVYKLPFSLNSSVPYYREIERTVYIKAPRSALYGEIDDLIGAVKEAGADPVGLIAYRPAALR